MSLRSDLYRKLIAELLGPRGGPEETFVSNIDPREEYMTGIIEPKDFTSSSVGNISKSDITTNVSNEESEEDASDSINEFDTGSTILGPSSFPKSMGISFIVRTSDFLPKISFCVTWGRYTKETTESVWKRTPHKFTMFDKEISTNESWHLKDLGARVVLRSVKLKDQGHHVSLFLVNSTPINPTAKRIKTQDLIFQPQIRIKLPSNLVLKSLDEIVESDSEHSKDLLTYQKFPTFARGHLCGATWKEIDFLLSNEQSQHQNHNSGDILLLDQNERDLFLVPDLRTDYLPSYISRQLSPSLTELNIEENDMRADLISEKNSPEQVILPLQKVLTAYSKWIDKQELELNTIADDLKNAGHEILSDCKSCMRRIQDGIKCLQDDDDARLAFCFMNRAMDIQSKWSRNTHLSWRPFQLAFILQCIRGIIDERHHDREVCDLLWFPTGGGKTEAYLGLMIFTIVYRRRKLLESGNTHAFGTSVISRYTLRLLTIQQFRRTLKAMTACEYLRAKNWKPEGIKVTDCELWGGSRFSVGLWVGGDVTPNTLVDRTGFDRNSMRKTRIDGAISILKYANREYRAGEKKSESSGEPAQVASCPCCSAVLALPSEAVPAQNLTIYLTFTSEKKPADNLTDTRVTDVTIHHIKVHKLLKPKYYVAEIKFTAHNGEITDEIFNQWWKHKLAPLLNLKSDSLVCTFPSRPGYFIKTLNDAYRSPYDFEIRCPNRDCELNAQVWEERILDNDSTFSKLPIIEPFQLPEDKNKSCGIPIPAYTVDAQVYAWCPSIVIATVDKFARLSFEPRVSSIFGNVNIFDTNWGYYRKENPPETGSAKLSTGVEISGLRSPDLILQDELHLIDGPLGSMVGLYESVIEALTSKMSHDEVIRAKYIASTATIHEASSQTISLYDREVKQFPPLGLSIGDNFFSRMVEGNLNDVGPGRLYVGVCAPGKGPQSPVVNIWSRLLQECQNRREQASDGLLQELDYYWTIVGYFNAVKELAQAVSLYRQDIPERIGNLTDTYEKRQISITSYLELSSRIDSLRLPLILDQLARPSTDIDAIMSTSMFGTGVDIDRLSLMIVHGQPKTTSSYIQATGRVGRRKGALVVTFLRSTRVRDLAHYEFFTGYHRSIQRQVEPVTVAPFSPRACVRALGPVFVGILRNGKTINGLNIPQDWSFDRFKRGASASSGSRKMSASRTDPEIREILSFLEKRAQKQPIGRRRPESWVSRLIGSKLDLWRHIAITSKFPLFYYEASANYKPQNSVVLGDAIHEKYKLDQVFETTPTSLRDIEPTARFD